MSGKVTDTTENSSVWHDLDISIILTSLAFIQGRRRKPESLPSFYFEVFIDPDMVMHGVESFEFVKAQSCLGRNVCCSGEPILLWWFYRYEVKYWQHWDAYKPISCKFLSYH